MQVVSKLYQSAYFPPVRDTVLASLFAMLLSRLYTAAQNDLVDTLFRWVGNSDSYMCLLHRAGAH